MENPNVVHDEEIMRDSVFVGAPSGQARWAGGELTLSGGLAIPCHRGPRCSALTFHTEVQLLHARISVQTLTDAGDVSRSKTSVRPVTSSV